MRVEWDLRCRDQDIKLVKKDMEAEILDKLLQTF